MKKTKAKTGVVILIMAFLMTGCGEKPIQLTEQEETIITDYAAHIVSKYNTRQRKGVVNVPQQEPEEKQTEEQQTEQIADTETGTEQTAANGEDGNNTQPGETKVSLNEAAAMEGIDIQYVSAEIKDDYQEGDYYALDASEGKQFLVLHFNLSNNGADTVHCDVLSRQIKFRAVVNGNIEAAAETTILLDDLGTYNGAIAAGGSVPAVLLFKVPAGQIQTVDRVTLEVRRDGAFFQTDL